MVHFGQLSTTAVGGMRHSRRALSRELQSAREVQARLFPRDVPRLRTLDLAAFSAPAHSVGGDYYDFLPSTPDRFGLAVGDVSGKGVPAALMMAALHASLRSNYSSADVELSTRLASVNRLFAETTAAGHYATLFVAEYHEDSGRLRYANCGHLPPILVRRDGSIDWLAPTATVLGVFEHWTCGTADVQLEEDDTLVLYTDGVTEARSATGELFGEARLLDAIRRHRSHDVERLLIGIVSEVRHFAEHPTDDLTVLTLRAKRRARGAVEER